MPLIVWHARYSVGIRSINLQHRRMVGIINGLYDDIQAGKGTAHINEVFQEMNGYAKTHFFHEEFLMKYAGYRGLEEHLRSHAHYVRRVADMARGFSRQPEDVLSFLKEWWITHITREDMLYKEALKDLEPRQTVSLDDPPWRTR